MLDYIAALRIVYFRNPPYRYAGTFAYEQEYLASYLDNDCGLFILAQEEGAIQGVLTAVSFAKIHHWFGDVGTAYREKGYEFDKILYIGEIIVSPEYRNKKVAGLLLKKLQESCRSTYHYFNLCSHRETNAETRFYQQHDFSNYSGGLVRFLLTKSGRIPRNRSLSA